MKAFISEFQGYLKELLRFWEEAKKDNDWDLLSQRLSFWGDKIGLVLSEEFSEDQAIQFRRSGLQRTALISDNDYEVYNEIISGYRSFLIAFLEYLGADMDKKFGFAKPKLTSQESSENKKTKVGKKDIFIVHGHDLANALVLQNHLKTKFKLKSIILKDQPGKGRTLIEKFEEEAKNCGFAFILYDPDDPITKDGETYHQARPNVIFELGYFYGKLERSKTCLLFKEGTKIPSDLAGINYVEYSKSIEEGYLQIERELKAVGLIE